jgi:CO dehydrogenase maturation factor
MKIAVTGKGGVGKTTLASLLSKAYAADGYTVLAIDANPDPNLAMALGIPLSIIEKTIPISKMEGLIEERTGAKPGTSGGYFKLNPRVDDIPDRFAISTDHIKILFMGTVQKGGGGCICPESALLKSLTSHLVLRRSEVIIMDMDAGFEHIGRGTAAAVDAFIVVVEPGQRSVQTAKVIKRLAKDIGVDKVYAVGSKIKSEEERAFIKDNLSELEILGFIDYNPKIGEADLKGQSVYEYVPEAAAEAIKIKNKLIALHKARS